MHGGDRSYTSISIIQSPWSMLDIVFPFAGGLGLFLIGMMLLSEGLVAFAGGSLQKVLLTLTGRPIKAFASGALITALAQSSTATTVTLIGFVSAGLITFSQAIGVVIGASFGNTATGWIVAGLGLKINLGFYTLPLIGLGALLKLLGKGRGSELGRALAGFGMLFLGLTTLQDGMQGLAASFSLAHLPAGGYGAYLLIMLIGLALTAVLQSSTAAIAMTLTALDAGAVNFDQAAAVVIGAAIGTTLTGVLVSIGGTVYAKRTAVAYILFNVASGLLALALLPLFLPALHAAGAYIGVMPGATALAAFHSFFIAVGALFFLPFTDRFAALVQRLLPGRATQVEHHLDTSLLGVPTVALEASQRALRDIAARLIRLYRQTLDMDAPASAQEALRQMSQVLDEAYEFVARIQLPADDVRLNERRSAQLHAVDHLLRLLSRIRDVSDTGTDFHNPLYQEALTQARNMAMAAQEGLDRQASDDWTRELETGSAALAELLRQARRDLLAQPPAGGAAALILRTTDVYRWFERTGAHIWRASHYLALARDAAQPVQPLQASSVKANTPAANDSAPTPDMNRGA
ncbi:Na/Pi cotransporter family protein [Pusillimonas caeni]|uniref:Na/Pi cotransporter family protein n=1 Tax=Pusillimonas caeni TaxID=1348472 RepID=UPI000E5991BA|nr:Na/Pi symporter [Pusillimonas caeni]TFL15414.1 Na/Pi cotransporter family protein [Pusillimonas caeni]